VSSKNSSFIKLPLKRPGEGCPRKGPASSNCHSSTLCRDLLKDTREASSCEHLQNSSRWTIPSGQRQRRPDDRFCLQIKLCMDICCTNPNPPFASRVNAVLSDEMHTPAIPNEVRKPGVDLQVQRSPRTWAWYRISQNVIRGRQR
jgi:hypothetical protein